MIEKIFFDELVKIRHDLHRHPELSEKEVWTTDFIRKQLEKWQIKVLPSELVTGLVAVIGQGQPVIGLRADLDGLPILEQTGLDFASENPGVMHACGHDLHMASLLGAAKLLKDRESTLPGTIKLIFQPSEEHGTGADMILESGLIADVSTILGFHNIPTIGVGKIGLLSKGVMATCEQFFVTIKGVGSHAAYPHQGLDPILATSAIIQNLQQIVSRNVPALDAAVLSVTHVEAGNTWNVLPAQIIFEGTIRTFDEADAALTKRRFIEVVEHTAAAYGVTADIEWIMGSRLTYNDPALTQVVLEATQAWATPDQVPTTIEPSMASEDFANYRQQVPTVFALIGSNEPGSSGLHFADLIVQDQALHSTVPFFVNGSLALLNHFKK